MLAAQIRSGLVETMHDGSIAVVSPDGDLVAHTGDIDRPYYLRSAAKPFQAAISQAQGAGLAPVELAMAAASHDGEPVHVAIVESMLASAGLDATHLGCPPSWPLSESARHRLIAGGATTRRSVWHNCSGKHTAFLRASRERGWPTESYLSREHPLQLNIAEFLSELGGARPEIGVDGCGAPVFATTTRRMARLYARLATDGSLRQVFSVMHRYPALVSGGRSPDAALSISINGVAKRGAAGCLGVAIESRLGMAVKSWDGLQEVAGVGMVATLAQLGELSSHAMATLAAYGRPPVLGGDKVVGALEPMVELKRS